MTLPINTVYPSYNNVGSYSGVNTAIRSAGLVSNAEQAEAVASAQRDGRLGLSQFAFLKIPQNVLFLQDERGAKIKSGTISSTTQSDLDDERLLEKTGNTTQNAVPSVEAKGGQGSGGGNGDGEQKEPESLATAATNTNDTVDLPSGILGTGNEVYQGVITASHERFSGQNLSVLA